MAVMFAERRTLVQSRPKAFEIDQLAESLPEAAARLRERVETTSGDDLKLIFGALQVQVTASRDQVQIEGSVPVLVPEGEDLVTIEHTSRCSFNGDQKLQAVPFRIHAGI